MSSLKISVSSRLEISPEKVFQEILLTENWESFRGFGPLPGIKQAQFTTQTPEVVGSKIKVVNSDGSSHVETITNWQKPHSIDMHLSEFSPPLAYFASHFTERWQISDTVVVRSMTLHAKSIATVPILWLIGIFLKRALLSHTKEIGGA